MVTALPEQTVDSSLYSEGNDSIRILTTRYRMRPIKEDTREPSPKTRAQHPTSGRSGSDSNKS